jgi:large subunit ribosomal protein L30
MAERKKIRVTLVRSPAGRIAAHRACVTGLGLRKLRQSVVVADTPENRGMIGRVAFLLQVEEA